MSDVDLKPKVHPILASLPDYLKDPENFKKIQAKIVDTMISSCGHSDIIQWSECKKCTDKMLQRRLLLRKLGFKNPAQYMMWRKVHEKIAEHQKMILPKYNAKI